MRGGQSAVSALWRHSHPWGYGVWLLVSGGFSLVWPVVGLTLLWGGLACVLWELMAKSLAVRSGHVVLYVLPSPTPWVTQRLRALGYGGPVAPHLWEMHVNESIAWHHRGDPDTAVQQFQAAYTADRLAWMHIRPDDVGLIMTTFNRLPSAQLEAFRAAGAWMVAGPLDSRIPSVASAKRQRQTQRRMFGRVMSWRDRTNPADWTTVYVPPMIQRQPRV